MTQIGKGHRLIMNAQLRHQRDHIHRCVIHRSSISLTLKCLLATKCDDISCSEVIRALQLDDEPVLEEIEVKLEQFREEASEWKEKKADAERNAKGRSSSMDTSSWLTRFFSDRQTSERGPGLSERIQGPPSSTQGQRDLHTETHS